MNTEPNEPERDATYLAEGETPDGASVSYVGVERPNLFDPGESDEPEEPPIDWPARSRKNRRWRFRCAGRTGAKIQEDLGGATLVEFAA